MDKQQIKQLGKQLEISKAQKQFAEAIQDLTNKNIPIKDIRVEFGLGNNIIGFNIMIPFDSFLDLFPDHEEYDDPMWLVLLGTNPDQGLITYQAQQYKINKTRSKHYAYPNG